VREARQLPVRHDFRSRTAAPYRPTGGPKHNGRHPLRGIGRTAPYFHNNSAATLEEVLDHYDAFFRRVARTNPPPNLPPIISTNGLVVDRGFVAPSEREALLAYLRKL
jgi:cytochrome c peroxidase